MEKIEFKKNIKNTLLKNNFKQFKKWFIMDCEELFIGIILTKSNFSELYYVDCGIFVKQRWNDEQYASLSPYEAEIRYRIDSCPYLEVAPVDYEKTFSEKLNKFLQIVTGSGIKKLKGDIAKNPYQYFLKMPLEEAKEWSPIWK